MKCSQCPNQVARDKGFTVSYYKGKDEKEYKCCSVACVSKARRKHKGATVKTNANSSKASL